MVLIAPMPRRRKTDKPSLVARLDREYDLIGNFIHILHELVNQYGFKVICPNVYLDVLGTENKTIKPVSSGQGAGTAARPRSAGGPKQGLTLLPASLEANFFTLLKPVLDWFSLFQYKLLHINSCILGQVCRRGLPANLVLLMQRYRNK